VTVPLSDRVAKGVVVVLSDRERALFPVGTVVTRDAIGVLTASVPVTKPGERDKLAHVGGLALGIIALPALAMRVREHFPPPPVPESPS
jgi:hypothetical protein